MRPIQKIDKINIVEWYKNNVGIKNLMNKLTINSLKPLCKKFI